MSYYINLSSHAKIRCRNDSFLYRLIMEMYSQTLFIFYESDKSSGIHLFSFVILWISTKFFNIMGLDVLKIWDNLAILIGLNLPRLIIINIRFRSSVGIINEIEIHIAYSLNKQPRMTLLVEPSSNTLLILQVVPVAAVPC